MPQIYFLNHTSGLAKAVMRSVMLQIAENAQESSKVE